MRYVKVAVPDDFDATAHKLVIHETDNITDNEDLCSVWEPQYRDMLDKGFIGMVDFMGDDQTVVNSARVSYGAGTKRVSEDRNLLRYLMRHRHWTPFEMVEVMWHVKAPIFVFRQWHRHRAASINEYSARYSVMADDTYMPDLTALKPQSSTNKQGRDGELSESNAWACQLQLQHAFQEASQAYKYLLGETNVPSTSLNRRYELVKEFAIDRIKWLEQHDAAWEPNSVTEEMIDAKMAEIVAGNGLAFTDEKFLDEGGGLSRELARICLTLATYSEMYWKADLRNTFNFIGLRSDPHAQEEIRVYSDAMLEMLEPIAPICVAGFVDYQLKGRQFSTMELDVVKHLYDGCEGDQYLDGIIEGIMKDRGASKREIKEFMDFLQK